MVRQAVDKGLRVAASARTRTRLAAAASTAAPPSPPVARTDPPAPPSGCPRGRPAWPHAPPANSRCVFTQTESAPRDGAAPPLDSDLLHGHPAPRPHDHTVRSFQDMPGPKGYPVVGTLLEYFRKENRGRIHEIQVRTREHHYHHPPQKKKKKKSPSS